MSQNVTVGTMSTFPIDDLPPLPPGPSTPAPPAPLITYGWECPRCRKINAPSVTSCDCPAHPYTGPGWFPPGMIWNGAIAH